MKQLSAIVAKELSLLFRDLHGLLLLFVMPVIFILIMSLAMKGDFDRRSGVQLEVLVADQANNPNSQKMLSSLANNKQFKLIAINQKVGGDSPSVDINTAEQAVGNDEYSFLLSVSAEAFEEDQTIADVLVSPSTNPLQTQLFVAALREAALRQKLTLLLGQLEELAPEITALGNDAMDQDIVSLRYSFQAESAIEPSSELAPTSVQQSVPAWLVFSMFFVVVPLANTFIQERNFGTLRRITTISVPLWKLIIGKIIPYFFVNQIQMLLMLIVGLTLVPWLGGDRLTLGNSIFGLLLISSAVSLAALGYAMLIAVISRTTEQATTLGGAGNIILAALGGIMVPVFVMPHFMQVITKLSPMSWGLQGFLDIFLRGGGVYEVWPEAALLMALGFVALSLALILLNRETKR